MPHKPIIAVFGGSAAQPGESDYEAAIEAGSLLARAGYQVATGGYAGIMEAAAIGAREAGGEAIGVTVPSVFPDRDGANSYISSEVRTASLTERIHELVSMSSASMALPGSIGTLTELIVAWNNAFVARFSNEAAKPVVAVGETWTRLVAELSDVLETDPSIVSCHDTVADAVAHLVERLG
ncbi:MAG: LOG family protein [Acidimicrobiia bacterium]